MGVMLYESMETYLFAHRFTLVLELSRFSTNQDLGNGLIMKFMSLYIHQRALLRHLSCLGLLK